MSRTEWILGLLLAGLLIVVAYFAVTFWLGPDEVTEVDDDQVAAATRALEVGAVPTASFVGETALLAFGLAQQEIISWQSDAVLLSAKSTFPYGSSQDEISDGRSNWTMSFYSPGAREVRTVSVVSGTVNVIGDRSVDVAFTPAGIGGWRLDSNEILVLFLNEGGSSFLEQNNVASLTMALTTDNESGRVEWLVSLFGDQTNRSLTMRMDAGSGELLETLDAP